jgi:hypothetical protein
MMGKGKIGRVGAALCLAGALMMTSFGCQPTANTSPSPNKNKPTDQKPDNKPKIPKPEVG